MRELRQKIGLSVAIVLFILTMVASANSDEDETNCPISIEESRVLIFPTPIAHLHNGISIMWERDGTKDGSTTHNHRTNTNFGGLSVPRIPYTASSCWDNNNNRPDGTGNFDNGHCYVEENKEPKYYFVNPGNWPADAKARVRDAFDKWSSVSSDRVSITVGCSFKETEVEGDANTKLYWEDINDNDNGGSTCKLQAIPEIKFDSKNADGNPWPWSFDPNPANAGAGQWHFLSVALHEIGHVVGFSHTTDGSNDLMDPVVGQPAGTVGRRVYQDLDADAIEGVRDVYSYYLLLTDTPLLSPWGLLFLSLLLMATVFLVWHRRRNLYVPVALPFFLLVFALSFYLSSGI